LIDPVRYSQIYFVRLGIYTGVLLAPNTVFSVFLKDLNTLNGLYLVPLWPSPVFPEDLSLPANKWGAKAVNVTH
jgi:hypothetical protein